MGMLTNCTLVQPPTRVGLVVGPAAVVAGEYGVHEIYARADDQEDVQEEDHTQDGYYSVLVATLVARQLEGPCQVFLQPFEPHRIILLILTPK